MSYTVGLDFGTHQTKVCVEDASNPAQKIYEFFEFKKPGGKKTVFLPSVVQINNDATVSYGFVDDYKEAFLSEIKKPILILREEPELLFFPAKPKMSDLRGLSIIKMTLFPKAYEKRIKQWEEDCKNIEKENSLRLQGWDRENRVIKSEYEHKLRNYNEETKKREKICFLAKSEKGDTDSKQVFRYFKIESFKRQNWEHSIDPEVISVWYITYVLFLLQERYGSEFYTQMGAPYTVKSDDEEKKRRISFKILISANMLLSKYVTLEKFLNAQYTELLQNTLFIDYTEQDVREYGINVLPEAFAGLSSVTQQGIIGTGMHLLVDIGGGTTDIAFFTVGGDKLPNIHSVRSLYYGLNNIYEDYKKDKSTFTQSDVYEIFNSMDEDFKSSIVKYHDSLKKEGNVILGQVKDEFLTIKDARNLEITRLYDALKNRPIVYCGGGSIFNNMRIKLPPFTDVKTIKKELLGIPYIKNPKIDPLLFPILATSYGLSIQLEDEIQMTPIEKLFTHLPKIEKKERSSYIHGVSDF